MRKRKEGQEHLVSPLKLYLTGTTYYPSFYFITQKDNLENSRVKSSSERSEQQTCMTKQTHAAFASKKYFSKNVVWISIILENFVRKKIEPGLFKPLGPEAHKPN